MTKQEAIETYLSLRKRFTDEEWAMLEYLRIDFLNKKKSELTKDVTLDDSDYEQLKANALKVLGISE
ncbi:hypothetical protein [Streptococcus sp. NLN64]|uniref:hypothetical protein n=1 Tax=Streptococcus sp. NLN64 TaxID=2822799 RepID=UPI0018CABC78|nr:hypothetical protein [Streptococcus sp. NLN64]MBG9366512.1 hypothetical protein [Streptococcus sp. NLN64]